LNDHRQPAVEATFVFVQTPPAASTVRGPPPLPPPFPAPKVSIVQGPPLQPLPSPTMTASKPLSSPPAGTRQNSTTPKTYCWIPITIELLESVVLTLSGNRKVGKHPSTEYNVERRE
jgi:hypothetical protein